MNVIEEIHRRLPNTHLVMHGSSSVPQELQDMFNQFGGEMPQTWGVPVEEILRGIRHGVRKVNIDTDCRLAMTAASARSPRDQERIRPAQIPEAGDGRHARVLPGTLRAVRHRRQCRQDQGDAAGGNGAALSQPANSILGSEMSDPPPNDLIVFEPIRLSPPSKEQP